MQLCNFFEKLNFYVYVPICMYVHHVMQCLRRPEEGTGSSLGVDLQAVVSHHEDARN